MYNDAFHPLKYIKLFNIEKTYRNHQNNWLVFQHKSNNIQREKR